MSRFALHMALSTPKGASMSNALRCRFCGVQVLGARRRWHRLRVHILAEHYAEDDARRRAVRAQARETAYRVLPNKLHD